MPEESQQEEKKPEGENGEPQAKQELRKARELTRGELEDLRHKLQKKFH